MNNWNFSSRKYIVTKLKIYHKTKKSQGSYPWTKKSQGSNPRSRKSKKSQGSLKKSQGSYPSRPRNEPKKSKDRSHKDQGMNQRNPKGRTHESKKSQGSYPWIKEIPRIEPKIREWTKEIQEIPRVVPIMIKEQTKETPRIESKFKEWTKEIQGSKPSGSQWTPRAIPHSSSLSLWCEIRKIFSYSWFKCPKCLILFGVQDTNEINQPFRVYGDP